MKCSKPRLAFRATFTKTDYKEGKPPSRMIMDDYGRLTIEEKKILLYLLNNDKISRKEAMKLLSLGKSKVFEILNTLTEKGY